MRISVAVMPISVGMAMLSQLVAVQAGAEVGDLGPPPPESVIKAVLTDFYESAKNADAAVAVQFDGPILVGPAKDHVNPPPRPLCVRCAHPEQSTSPMYPVLAVVRVTTTQQFDTSALGPGATPESTVVTYNGTPCAEIPKRQYCPYYYFYRDEHGNWQVA